MSSRPPATQDPSRLSAGRASHQATSPVPTAKSGFFRHYTFVDYATQIYSGLVALMVLFLHNHTVPDWPLFVVAHLVGLGIVHAIVHLHGEARHPNRFLVGLRHFYPVVTYLFFFSEIGQLDRMIFPEFLDPAIVELEQWLFGTQPSRRFMELLPYRVVSEMFYAAYFSYYIMIVGVGIALFRQNRRHFFHYISVVSFIFYVCYLSYVIFPVVGPPIFYFQGRDTVLPPEVHALFANSYYPDAVRSGFLFQVMAFLYRTFDSPGAALPSSHVVIALTTVFFSFRYLRRIRYLHLGVAFLLCLATIYCRYHYVVDVIAGLITVAVLIPVANRLYFRFEEEPREPLAETKPPQSERS